MQRRSVGLLLFLTLLAVLAPAGRANSTDSLTFFNNWFVTGDYAVAGVGLRGTGVNGLATGKINITGVPSNAQPIAAFLYWSTAEVSATPGASVGYFNTNKIQGAVLGNPQTPNAGCSSSGGGTSGYGFVYRADVLRYLPVNSNNIPQANGNQTVALPDAGRSGSGTYTNGASLVVIYKIVVPGLANVAPLRAVVIYNGAYTLDKQTAPMIQNVAGFYQSSAFGAARMTSIVANGEPGFSSSLSANGLILDSSPFRGAQGARWDNPSYNINLAANSSSFPTMATAGTQTCLTFAAIVASVNVPDSDGDGLLDLWETQGLHRNTQVFPATFGTCAQYPAEPCVNLPAMGANPNKRDIFVQIDWMHGTGDGTGGTDGHGTHDHMPQLAALNTVATAFATNGINLHFDVGPSPNYQGKQALCGNAPCSFIVPSTYAQGGSDIPESSLLCQNTATHTCDYQEPYPVVSFEFGFASVRDGNSLLKISPHFAQNRKDIFHYSLFAHALAGPFNAQGQPINPFTSQPTTTPLSYSGIAHRPGGGFMVTLGLWRSDIPAYDQVGSTQVQAGTLMHELGHNLGLGHAGLSSTPNCEPNYPSVMNYLYQTRGLTDKSGNEQVDYSYGSLLPLSEDFLSASVPMGFVQRYRVRYYGPLAPNQPPAQAAQLHCDGTPLAAGSPFEVRLEGLAVSTPDWSNGTVPLGKVSPPLDVNYDGITGQWFADQPDWFALNLQQIGTGYSFGGLSVGAFATDGGAYATDGGAFATDAGALATDGGAFATDGGAFATDGGAFATDGGAFATDGGAFATDGGAFATDAGEIDQTTVLLSSVDPPATLTATNTGSGTTLTWTPPSVGQIANYNIYRCAVISPATTCTPALFASSPGGTPTPTFTDAVSETMPPYHSGKGGSAVCNTSTCYNTIYYYFVTSVVSVTGMRNQESGDSNTVNNEVPHQFVIANAQPNIVYGAAIPVPTASIYGDGSLAISSVTCNYGTVIPRNVGTYPIVCKSSVTPPLTDGVTFNAQYLGNIPGTLTITQLPITVTAVASSKVYNGGTNAQPGVIPAVTGNLAYTDTPGFIETYDNKNVGATHVMTASGVVNDMNGGLNYNVTFKTFSTGVITPAPLTATITGSETYGGTNVVFSASYAPLLGGDLPSVVTGTLTSCAASAKLNVGTYPNAISGCTGLTAQNYTISYASGTFTVNPAPLTATITGSQTYGGTSKSFVPPFMGLVNNDSPSVVTGILACTPSASLAVGSYQNAITGCSGLIASNYTISYVSGTFTVNPAPLTANISGSQTYGGTNQSFAATLMGLVNNDSPTVVGGTLACTTSATITMNAGSHAGLIIGCSGLTASNYTISYALGTYTIYPAPQSIQFAALSSQPFGIADFPVAATASSGLPVTFTASGNCSLTPAGLVHLTATGSCTITASQSGGLDYLAAAPVMQIFSITAIDFSTLLSVGSPSDPTTKMTSTLSMTTSTGETSAAWLPAMQVVGNGFTTQFSFQISQGNTPTIADGFAFVIQGSPAGTSALGTTGMGGYLGYQGIPNSLAIEFDTFQNSWDPNANHIAIQSNGTLVNSADHTTGAKLGINSTIATLSQGSHTAMITYDGTTLSVFLDGAPMPVLSAAVNLTTFLGLSSGNAVVGFTAATGSFSETTVISGWSFSSN